VGTTQGVAKGLRVCACGRRTRLSMQHCYSCRKGWPWPGETRACATCGVAMKNVKDSVSCQSCRTLASWKRGIFANVRVSHRWTPEEDAAVVASAGHITPAEIAQQIGRSKSAVHKRAQLLGVYLTTLDWSACRVATLFGCSEGVVARRWLDTGMLKATKTPPRKSARYGVYRIKTEAIEQFIRDCPWAYDPLKMKPETHTLALLAKRIHRRDPWLTSSEVAARLGMSNSSIWGWYSKGLIPTRQRWVGSAGTYVVAEADMPAIFEMLKARRANARGAAKLAVLNARVA
jgi:predicted DNA-binding transcriptional regulator AlpA